MPDERQQPKKAQPFLGVMFDCCNAYVRIYKNREGTHYVGRCPKCFRTVRFTVGQDGSGARFWRVK